MLELFRFWNAAFLHAVHTERKLRIPSDKNFSEQTDEQRLEYAEVHKNIFFGQLTYVNWFSITLLNCDIGFV